MFLKQTILLLVALVLRSSSALPAANSVLDLEAYFKELDESNSQERVVGGNNVAPDEYIPYQISMQYKRNNGQYGHFCGGSIISPNRILTAAHCVNGQDPKRISVVAGINNLNDKSGTRSQVKSFEMHENYQELVTSDIAMLTIDPPLEIDGKRIDIIDAFDYEPVGEKQEVLLTGWGSVHHFGNGILARYPKELQKLNYHTISNERCKQTMKQLTETEICALERFGKGACNGDSGGPLVMNKDGKLKQVGVVSYGTAFCASNSPDVYTRVSQFFDWIKERMA
ncbi:chymotrypsin-1-like [Cochliomyia hominivorax]